MVDNEKLVPYYKVVGKITYVNGRMLRTVLRMIVLVVENSVEVDD